MKSIVIYDALIMTSLAFGAMMKPTPFSAALLTVLVFCIMASTMLSIAIYAAGFFLPSIREAIPETSSIHLLAEHGAKAYHIVTEVLLITLLTVTGFYVAALLRVLLALLSSYFFTEITNDTKRR